MLALQVGASFALWLAWGVIQWRRSLAQRERLVRSGRTKRAAGGLALLIGSAVLLLGGLIGLQALEGIRGGALTPWAWLAVTLLGAGFVHAQASAAALLASLQYPVVTEGHRPASRMGGSPARKEL